MKTALLTWTASALLGSAAFAAPPVVGGAVTHQDTAVVALTILGGSVYCSGTLVSPKVVVTAAHCVHGMTPAYVFFGTDPAADGLFVPVDSVVEHPDYKTHSSVDIGLVILARPVTIRPILLPDHDLAQPELTGMIELIGFGDTEAESEYSPTGVKYGREVQIARVDASFVQYGVGACHGDSGGATLAHDPDGTERLVGVISRGDAACAVGGSSTRVDLYADWIQHWIAAMDPASCDLDTRCAADCATPDPDCAGPAPIAAAADDTGGCHASGGGGGGLLVLVALGLVLHRRRS